MSAYEPTSLRAGDTWKWKRSDLTDYPSPTWTLRYEFKNATANFEIIAAQDGSTTAFAVTVAMATTAAYSAGKYSWVAFVTNGTERYTVDSGTFEVAKDYGDNLAFDGRTHARKTLESINAVIEGRASRDQQEYSIGDRTLKRTPMADLIMLQTRYSRLVAAEENEARLANGLGTKNVIRIRG
jgi:hypothetical protein